MNKKWFTGIGFGLFLAAGALIYTTIPQARVSSASSSNKNLENLTGCATDKNPGFLANVIIGAVGKYDKDVKAALRSGNTGQMAKHRTALLHVISFLLKESKHFSPTYKEAEHKPAFDKALDKQIQKMYKAEYAAAKDPKMQGEVTKDYRAIVKALEADGVKGLSKIVTPAKAKKKADKKAKKGSAAARKAANAAKHSGIKAAGRSGMAAINGFLSGKSPTEIAQDAAGAAEGSVEDDVEQAVDGGDAGDDAPADDAGDDAPADDAGDDAPADDAGDDAPADDSGDDAPADDAPADDAGEDAYADEAGDDAPADDAGEDAYADEAGDDAPADDDSGDEASTDDSGDEQYTEED
jgi:hypothetical protein